MTSKYLPPEIKKFVSRETLTKLDSYIYLLKEWNNKLNLVSKSSIEHLWERHILDSLQLLLYIKNEDKVLDFGSGAGFPGIILGICGINITLVESINKKCVFLENVKSSLNLENVRIINDRIENINIIKNCVITARAVASLDKLLTLSKKHNIFANKCLFLKGRSFQEEIIEAEKLWSFKLKDYKSITSDDSKILEIKNIKWKS